MGFECFQKLWSCRPGRPERPFLHRASSSVPMHHAASPWTFVEMGNGIDPGCNAGFVLKSCLLKCFISSCRHPTHLLPWVTGRAQVEKQGALWLGVVCNHVR